VFDLFHGRAPAVSALAKTDGTQPARARRRQQAAGGGKSAAIGAISGGVAGLIYDRLTANPDR
jgi:hypothetical protein